MHTKTIQVNGANISIVQSDTICIADTQSALDFMMTMRYENNCDCIVLNKEAITEDFFVLSTRVAGEILQKFINYQFKLAIVGNFSHYKSQPLKDFIYESNNGKDIFFLSTEEEAIRKFKNIL
ncbi:MAG: DUF4180 domain-containing protein [Oscillospiraceae bacterium]